MASNKKTKAPDASYMDITIGKGRTQRVERLDMSDAEWEDTKKTAIAKGIFKFAHDREAAKPEMATEPLKDGATVQDPLAEKKAAAREAANIENQRAPSESFTPEKPSKPMEEKVKETVQIKDGDSTYTVPAGSIDIEKLRKQNENVQDGTGGGTGTLGGKLRSVAAKLFEGASPEQSLEDKVRAANETETVDATRAPTTPAKPTSKMQSMMSKEMAADASVPPEAPVPARVTAFPSKEASPQAAPTPFPLKENAGLLDTVSAGVKDLLRPDANVMNNPVDPAAAPAAVPVDAEGQKIKAQMDAEMLKNRDNPKWWDSRPKAPAPGQTPTPAPTGGASSAKVSMSSKGIADPSMPPLVDRRAEFEKNAADLNAMKMKNAEADAAGIRAEADVLREGLRQQTDLELERRMADNVSREHVRKAQEAYTKTVEEAKAPEKLDPDRWWNPRRRIFAIVSAGLTRGATLGMFQDAIRADIQDQQHDITNARIANAQKADAQQNVYQMARQNGLDERAAYLTAESHAWDNVERASKLAAMSAKAPSVIAAAQEQAALANQQKTIALTTLDNHLETQGVERKKLFLEERKVDATIAKMNRPAGVKAPKTKNLMGPQASELGKLEASLEMTKKLSKEFGHPNLFQSLWDKARSAVDPTSPQAAFNKRVKALIQNIGPGMGSGVLNASDLARWDELAAKAGTVQGDVAWQALVDEIESKLNNTKKSYKQAGYDMHGYEGGSPDPESSSSEEAMNALLNQE